MSREVGRRSSTFRHFDGDEFIRTTPGGLQLTNALNTVALMLDEVARGMTQSNVVLDVALPASFVERTRERFGSSVMLVSLRVEKEQWQRRDARRTDRGRLQGWNSSLTALQGSEALYDLVVDTTHMRPDACAKAIVSKAKTFWDKVRI